MFRNYRVVDYMTQGYVLLVGLLVLFFHGARLPEWPLLLLAHVAALGGIHALVRYGSDHRGGFVRLLRACYPMLLYAFFYWETHPLDGLFVLEPLDAFFIRWDQLLFHTQASRTFITQVPSFFVSELLHLAYFSYYIMLPGVGLLLYVRDRRRFWQYVTVISFTFYVCYLIYIFLPVLGPHAHEGMDTADAALLGPRVVPGRLAAGPFFHVMQFVYYYFEPRGGAAFPSSHVAVALAALWFTWRYVPRLRWIHLADVVLLSLSTVYCGYHYGVDVLAGAVTAAVLVPLGDRLYALGLRPAVRPRAARKHAVPRRTPMPATAFEAADPAEPPAKRD